MNSTEKLALFGGKPIRENPFGAHPAIRASDVTGLMGPFETNVFSGFRAGQPEGGQQVQDFENMMKDLVGTKHSIAFDTWSNGLFSILLAIGIEPGDEVILPAYTMTACASSVLACGGVPIFADISDNCCLDPEDINRKISSRTKAIMVVHLFGMPADMDEIIRVASQHEQNITIIEDVAQAPLATYKGRECGSIGDVGGYSFTESKHVMSGEGGIAVTNNDAIANGLRYVRNHGEVNSLPGCEADFFNNMVVQNIVGFNFRLTELAAALGKSQLSRLREEVDKRRKFATYVDNHLKDIPYFYFPKVEYDFEHSYYCYTLRWKCGTVSRDRFVEALSAEGIPFMGGYCQPIYKQHIYHTKRHWAIRDRQDLTYDDLPVTEKINRELLIFLDMRSPNTLNDMSDIVNGIKKVVRHLEEL